jgi:hypothetical protein
MWQGQFYIGVHPLVSQPGCTQRTRWRLSKQVSNIREGFHGPVLSAQSTGHFGGSCVPALASVDLPWGRFEGMEAEAVLDTPNEMATLGKMPSIRPWGAVKPRSARGGDALAWAFLAAGPMSIT